MDQKTWIEAGAAPAIEAAVFILGGLSYGMMEMLYRGHTHWSMFITGGACAWTLFTLLDWLLRLPLAVDALAGAAIVTVYEFFTGCIVNLRFGWHIWDYSDRAGNLLGQICPAYSGLWFLLCLTFLSAVRLFR